MGKTSNLSDGAGVKGTWREERKMTTVQKHSEVQWKGFQGKGERKGLKSVCTRSYGIIPVVFRFYFIEHLFLM